MSLFQLRQKRFDRADNCRIESRCGGADQKESSGLVLAPQPMENPFPSISVADLQTGSLRAQQGRAAIISNLDPIKRLVGRRGDVGGNSTPHQTRSTRRARYDSCAKKADRILANG